MAVVINERASSTAYVNEIVDLVTIFQDEINCCVLRRRPSFELMNLVHRVDVPIRIQQMITCQDDLISQIASALPSEIETIPGIHVLLDDVSEVVEMYGLLLGAEQIGMRLVTLDRAMCPGFHVDKIGIRLVCTYRGPATQWLEHDEVDRSKLGLVAQGIQDEDSGLIKDISAIRSMQPFDIGLLKGESWVNQNGLSNQGNGVVHRSPKVDEGLRLLLTLDAF